MLVYILKSSACLAILLIFYKLFLEKEKMHLFKRFYLLTALVFAFTIPLITFSHYVEQSNILENTLILFQNSDIEKMAEINYLNIILWGFYGLGVAFFTIKFAFNLTSILTKIKQNTKHKCGAFTNVLLVNLLIPHTFFNYIFLNKQKFETLQIPNEVLLHEQTHATQKHSLDILFIELIQIIFWFNPLFYFIKKDIKLNHEFLADQAVLNKGYNAANYQNTLLAYSSNIKEPLPIAIGMANAINYSSIKKRFTVMKTQTSKQKIWLRSLILLPLLAILFYSFSNKNIIKLDSSLDNNNIEIIQKQATTKQVAEYNKLAKHYNEQPQDKRVVKLKDIERLEYLYGLMSNKQKKNAEPFPNCPPPPPAPETPNTSDVLEIIEEMPAPPPPPVPVNASDEQKAKYKKINEEYYKKYSVKNGEISRNPPPPPPPKSPLDHIIDMSKKGAAFYLEGKKISSDEAISTLKKNKSLNIQTTTSNSNKPIVSITKKPIIIKE